MLHRMLLSLSILAASTRAVHVARSNSQATLVVSSNLRASTKEITGSADRQFCSGHGVRLASDSDFCKCDSGFIGSHCEFDQISHKYVGSSKCVHGSIGSDGSCQCLAGWAGPACSVRLCEHGHLACPEGRHYCGELECVCQPGWTGPSCATSTAAAIAAGGVKCTSQLRKKVGECHHGGVFNDATCSCDCPAGSRWSGPACTVCSVRPGTESQVKCPQPLAQFNASTCACECNEDQLLMQPCEHGGSFNQDTCTCDCPQPWGGDSCNLCHATERHCYNGGRWNDFDCVCDCHSPWSPADRCLTCPLLDCKNGGVFLQDECRCKCEGMWTGDECDECPSMQELIIAGLDCKNRGFSESSCACNDECLPRKCLHGGVQNSSTCGCDCNIASPKLAKPALPPSQQAAEVKRRKKEEVAAANALIEIDAGESRQAERHLRDAARRVAEAVQEAEHLAGRSLDSGAASGVSHIFSSPTFWSGDRCELCVEPPPPGCGGARAFDMGRCACSDTCGPFNCTGYGQKDEQTCTCDCPLTRNGVRRMLWRAVLCCASSDACTVLISGLHCYLQAFCQFEANGESPESAAASCRIIRLLNRRAKSGWYWLSFGRVAPFQAYCDLADDGGGWTQIAKVRRTARMVLE